MGLWCHLDLSGILSELLDLLPRGLLAMNCLVQLGFLLDLLIDRIHERVEGIFDRHLLEHLGHQFLHHLAFALHLHDVFSR